MERMIETLEVAIPQGRTLRIREARGATIRMLGGTVWITEEDDLDDYALAAADTRTLATAGLTLVHAFEDARVEIGSPLEGSMRIELGGGYREYAAAVWSTQLMGVARRIGRGLRDLVRRPEREVEARC